MKRILFKIAILLVAIAVVVSTTTSAVLAQDEGKRTDSWLDSPTGKQAMIGVEWGVPEDLQPGGHTGLDFACSQGDPLYAVATGQVAWADWYPTWNQPSGTGYGNTIMIDHGTQDDGTELYSEYGHMNAFSVKQGDIVIKGQVIGTCGTTGAWGNYYVHTHFEIRKDILGAGPSTSWLGISSTYNPRLYLGKNVTLKVPDTFKNEVGKVASGSAVVVNTINPDGTWSQGHPPEGSSSPMPYIILGVIVLLGIVGFFWLRRQENRSTALVLAGQGMIYVGRSSYLKRVIREFIRGTLRWSLLWFVVLFVVVPVVTRQVVREGLLNFLLNGWVSISGKGLLLILLALVANAMYRAWQNGEAERAVNPNSGCLLTSSRFALGCGVGCLLPWVLLTVVLLAIGGAALKSMIDTIPDPVWQLAGIRKPDLSLIQKVEGEVKDWTSGLAWDKAKAREERRKQIDPKDQTAPSPKVQEVINDLKSRGGLGPAVAQLLETGSRTTQAYVLSMRACELEGGNCDPAFLTSIWTTETNITDCSDKNQLTATVGPGSCLSNAGAEGPFQFMPMTWPTYADPSWDKYNFVDAARAAWRMVSALGLPERLGNCPDFADKFSNPMYGGKQNLIWNQSYDQGLSICRQANDLAAAMK